MPNDTEDEWITRPVGGAFSDEDERVRAIEHSRHDVGGTQVRVDGWEDEDGNREYGVSVYKPRQGMTVSEAWKLAAAIRTAVTELDAVERRPPPGELPPIDPDPDNYRPSTLAVEEDLKEWELGNSYGGPFLNASIRCTFGTYTAGFIYRVELSRRADSSPEWISPNFSEVEDALAWAREAIRLAHIFTE